MIATTSIVRVVLIFPLPVRLTRETPRFVQVRARRLGNRALRRMIGRVKGAEPEARERITKESLRIRISTYKRRDGNTGYQKLIIMRILE